MQDIAAALERLVPGPKYFGSLTANTRQAYNLVIWKDKRRKPAFEELLEVDLTQIPKPELKKKLATMRWRRSIGGLKFCDHVFHTDAASQSAIAMAAIAALHDDKTSISWKISDGEFVTLSPQAIIGLANAIATFNRDLFKAEASARIAVDAGIITTEEQAKCAIGRVQNGMTEEEEEQVNGIRAQNGFDPDAASGDFPD